MKLLKIFGGVIIFLCVFVITSSAYAVSIIKADETTGNVKIESGEVIDDNIVTAGNEVVIRGEINDNVLAFGRTVRVIGKIHGSLFVAAQDVRIEGEVSKDVFAGASTVVIAEGAKVGRDLAVGASDLIIDGQIGRNIWAGNANLSINGKVEGDITAAATSISVSEKSEISGKLNYYAEKELNIKNKNVVTGGINFNKIETTKGNFASKITMWILALVMAIIIGALLLVFFPKRTQKIAESIKSNWLKSLGIGVLMLIVIPVVAIICMILIVGLPIGLILLAVYFILLYVAKIWVALCLGKVISHGKWNPYWIMICGVVILYLLYLIPFVGAIIAFLVILVGLGGLYLSKPMEGEK